MPEIQKSSYPHSDIFERAYLVKLFHNQSLRDKYLPETLPQVFLDKKRRLLVYLMRTLHDNSETITIDNADTLIQTVTGSFDPNDKNVFPTGYGSEGYITAQQELKYTIRFQNTGNDTAFIIVVVDTLPVSPDKYRLWQKIVKFDPQEYFDGLKAAFTFSKKE